VRPKKMKLCGGFGLNKEFIYYPLYGLCPKNSEDDTFHMCLKIYPSHGNMETCYFCDRLIFDTDGCVYTLCNHLLDNNAVVDHYTIFYMEESPHD
jgi:hypothetical protein